MYWKYSVIGFLTSAIVIQVAVLLSSLYVLVTEELEAGRSLVGTLLGSYM